jgi:hypothetical protein
VNLVRIRVACSDCVALSPFADVDGKNGKSGITPRRPRTRSMDKAEQDAAGSERKKPKALGRVALVNGKMVLLS